jgi:flagellar hook-associated protein 3 FlgL
MRITTNMTTNRMLLNLNRNATRIDNLYQQKSTGKKILHASENPIIASRALKFRTSISNTEQFQRNAAQGLSWMEITEAAFVNTEEALREIKTLINYAATGTNDISDRQATMRQIQTLFESLQTEMNIDYAGRYVFSGFRTDEPPTFITDMPEARFHIWQHFQPGDIERTLAVVRTGIGEEPEVFPYHRIKLPYNLLLSTDEMPRLTLPDGHTLTPAIISNSDPMTIQAAMEAQPPNFFFFIPELGEFRFDTNMARQLTSHSEGFTVDYIKEGFAKGELNPKVYFRCIDYTATTVVGTAPVVLPNYFNITNNPSMQLYIGGTWTTTFDYPADFTVDPTTLEVTFINPALQTLHNSGAHLDWFENGIFVACVPAATIVTNPPGIHYNMEGQHIKFEFGLNTQFQVNNLAKDVLTANLFADLKNLIEFTKTVELSTDDQIRTRLLRDFPHLINDPDELNRRVNEQNIKENGMFRDVMFDRLNNMLDLIDRHAAAVSVENATLGSRMNRLEMITERLEQDRLSYTRLMSENENVDLLEVIMRLNAAEAVYQASLMSGANIMQLTLADFIR